MGLKDKVFLLFLSISLSLYSCSGLEEVPLTEKEIYENDVKTINEWLDKNNMTDSVIVTKTGLRYVPRILGSGLVADSGDIVNIKFKGRLFNGTVFGQSDSASFTVYGDKVFNTRGADETLDSMRVGSKFVVLIPSKLAYGPNGYGNGTIPGDSPILYDIELFSLTKYVPEEIRIQNWIVEQGYEEQIHTLPNGLSYVIFHTDPNATKIAVNSKVKLNYVGSLLDGTVFESTYVSRNPFSFQVGVTQLIKGFDQGVQSFREGDSTLLIIPSKLGYGSTASEKIPANSVLVFKMKVLDVQ